jgi:hypothetical protein
VVAGKEAVVLTDDELELLKVVVPFSLKEALVVELVEFSIEGDEAIEVGTVVVVVKFNNNVVGSAWIVDVDVTFEANEAVILLAVDDSTVEVDGCKVDKVTTLVMLMADVESKIEIIVGIDVDGTAEETVVFNDGIVEEALLLEVIDVVVLIFKVDEYRVVEGSVPFNRCEEVEEGNVSLLLERWVVICWLDEEILVESVDEEIELVGVKDVDEFRSEDIVDADVDWLVVLLEFVFAVDSVETEWVEEAVEDTGSIVDAVVASEIVPVNATVELWANWALDVKSVWVIWDIVVFIRSNVDVDVSDTFIVVVEPISDELDEVDVDGETDVVKNAVDATLSFWIVVSALPPINNVAIRKRIFQINILFRSKIIRLLNIIFFCFFLRF